MRLISKEVKQVDGIWCIVRTYEEREEINSNLLLKSEEECNQKFNEIKALKEKIKA